MDNEEYREKLDRITRLCDEGNYEAAADVADGIDWKRRDPQTLCVIAGVYKKVGRYEAQKSLLKTAYRRSSGSKRILYHLVGCCLKTGDIAEAGKYLNEFEQLAPNDDSRFILKYKVQRASGADLDERIRTLVTYKEREYTERWGYELAKAYKENGQKEKCVAECDEMFLWFGEGKFVRKALDIKQEFADLSPAQRRFAAEYDDRKIRLDEGSASAEEEKKKPEVEVKIDMPESSDAAEEPVVVPPDDITKSEEPVVSVKEEEGSGKGFSSRFMKSFKSAFTGIFEPVDNDEEIPEDETVPDKADETASAVPSEETASAPAPEGAPAPAPSSYERETDESLGLTREFSFTEELSKLQKKQGGSSGKILTPEEEAMKAVAGLAVGATSAAETVLPAADPVTGEDSDEMIAPADEDALKELLKEDDGADTAPEETKDSLMDLSAEPSAEEEHSILDEILSERDMVKVLPVEGRLFTDRERRIFSYFASVPGVDMQVTAALADIHNNTNDKTSKSGNVVIMGRQDSGKTRLARAIMLAAADDMGLKGVRMARVIGQFFNDKDPAEVVRTVAGGFLLIEGAGAMEPATVEKLEKAMSFRTDDLVVILEDEKDDMKKLLDAHPSFASMFTSYITVPVFMNDELVSFAKTYAKERGYRLDEMSTLALYGLIGANQKESEPVTVGKVKDMVDRAIRKYHKSPRFGKAVKGGGRILLREKDFDF